MNPKPIGLGRKSEVTTDQSHQGDRQDCVGGNMQVEIHDRMEKHSNQPHTCPEHDCKFIAAGFSSDFPSG